MDALGDALCGCGDDAVELDERDDLPPTLSAYVINAMQAPHEVLDVHPKAPPWATRDNLRVNCLRLLARRERHFEAYVFRALAAHDATHGCPLERGWTAAARNRRPVVEAAEDDADDGLDDVAAEVLADVADALLPRAPPPRGGETTCCTPAPKPPDPEAGVELPTLSPLHDALREA
ncbi:hypothetical protein SO694_000960119 [Aureococcus anophagefferens]|uniref:Uncharacterized protein n=1 Tax=Aureococcus anophagefferens TaxID=44056 RepID=A0ABR1FSJ8_AURAN